MAIEGKVAETGAEKIARVGNMFVGVISGYVPEGAARDELVAHTEEIVAEAADIIGGAKPKAKKPKAEKK